MIFFPQKSQDIIVVEQRVQFSVLQGGPETQLHTMACAVLQPGRRTWIWTWTWTSSLLYTVTIFTVVWIVSGKSVCTGGCAESQTPSSGEQSLYCMSQYSLHTSVNLMLAFHEEIFQAVLYSVAKIIHANWSYLMDVSCHFCLVDTVDFFCFFK